ncbi:MAG: hypothetical protein ABIP67_08205 [Burkholderiales bacterium]
MLAQEGKVKIKTQYEDKGEPMKKEESGPDGALKSLREFDPITQTVTPMFVHDGEGRVSKEVHSKNGKPQKGEGYSPDGKLKTEYFFDAQGNCLNRIDYDEAGQKIMEETDAK